MSLGLRWVLILTCLSAKGLVYALPQSEGQGQPSAQAQHAETPAGLIPIPDYSGDFWRREYLTGGWGGTRADLANRGVQFDVLWTQYVQGVADGGRDRTTQYGGALDYVLTLDLMRMKLVPGALVNIRAETRYGESVNGASGSILPVNTDLSFPLTNELDENVPIAITDLNYTQFLSEHFGVVLGKLETLSGDLNEFASVRGTSQFQNANFVFNATLALRLPYSTLGGGLIWMPKPADENGGITVTSMLFNTADSSTTSGFDDFGEGATWNTEADFQYRAGTLPGGTNLGVLYSFDQDFSKLDSRLIFQPGLGFSIPKENSTWAVYASNWQYLFTEASANKPIDLREGRAHEQGFGFFTRVGIADKTTNPVDFAVSGGIGGRGLVPSRDDDTFGLGYFYNDIEESRFVSTVGAESSAQGFECFYEFSITPACHLALDAQVVESALSSIDTATIFGVRLAMKL